MQKKIGKLEKLEKKIENCKMSKMQKKSENWKFGKTRKKNWKLENE